MDILRSKLTATANISKAGFLSIKGRQTVPSEFERTVMEKFYSKDAEQEKDAIEEARLLNINIEDFQGISPEELLSMTKHIRFVREFSVDRNIRELATICPPELDLQGFKDMLSAPGDDQLLTPVENEATPEWKINLMNLFRVEHSIVKFHEVLDELFNKLEKKGIPTDPRKDALEQITGRRKHTKKDQDRDTSGVLIGDAATKKIYEYFLNLKNPTFKDGHLDRYELEKKILENVQKTQRFYKSVNASKSNN
jgi:hypothetical protein